MSATIEIRNLVKRYDGADIHENAVNGIDLDIAPGEFVTLLGPSGCGKTTTLRMIAGLERPTSGEISLGGEIVFSDRRGVNIPVNKRPIGMVFQSYAIWPHMNVFENVAFPLRMTNAVNSKKELLDRTERALTAVGLKDFIYRASTALSGGQQQRVALARALVKEPKILLLDEPLSNLDAKLREQMRDEIRELQERTKITTVFVTHDQSEALAVSDRIVVMNRGEIVELGAPRDVYQSPSHRFTADFIGISNTIEGVAMAERDGFWKIETPYGSVQCKVEIPIAEGERVIAYVRPESFRLSNTFLNSCWKGTVQRSAYQGGFTDYSVAVDANVLRVRVADGESVFRRGDKVFIHPEPACFRVRRYSDRAASEIPHTVAV